MIHEILIKVQVKVCKKCSQVLPVDSFYKNASKPDGLQTYCKRCFAGCVEKCRAKKRVQASRVSLGQKFTIKIPRYCSTCLHRNQNATHPKSPCYTCAKTRDKNAPEWSVKYAPMWLMSIK